MFGFGAAREDAKKNRWWLFENGANIVRRSATIDRRIKEDGADRKATAIAEVVVVVVFVALQIESSKIGIEIQRVLEATLKKRIFIAGTTGILFSNALL